MRQTITNLYHGAMMRIDTVDINQIKPYARNPRSNDQAVTYVANSLKEYGWQQPIVVDVNNIIIAGHTRYQAAQQLGIDQVPILIADQLTDEQVQAYRIADNKTHEYAQWDNNVLVDEINELLENNDISGVSHLTAFSELELDRLLNGDTYQKDEIEEAHELDGSPVRHRVGLLAMKNTYVNRGVATYVNGWCEWGLRNGVQVDVISDEDGLRNNQFDRYEATSNWLAPTQFENPGNDDDKTTMRSPIIRLNDAVKLRTSILDAMTRFHYDCLVINTIDVLFSVISLGLHRHHPNIYYVTHAPGDFGSMRNDFITELTHSLVKTSGVKILCQSEWVRDVFHNELDVERDKSIAITPFLGQPELLDFERNHDHKGILYIGPYEDRKKPELFIKACKENSKPALVITPSQRSADKFKRRFLEENIEHEIHVALTGKHKVDIIRRASLAVIPSSIETFCYTAFEAAHMCRTIIPSNREWSQPHKDWCILVPEEEIGQAVAKHYGKPQTEQAKQALTKAFKEADHKTFELLKFDKEAVKPNNALSKWLDQNIDGTVEDFFNTRPTKVIDEVFYLIRLASTEGYQIEHTKDYSIINKIV